MFLTNVFWINLFFPVSQNMLGDSGDEFLLALHTAVRCLNDPKKYFEKIKSNDPNTILVRFFHQLNWCVCVYIYIYWLKFGIVCYRFCATQSKGLELMRMLLPELSLQGLKRTSKRSKTFITRETVCLLIKLLPRIPQGITRPSFLLCWGRKIEILICWPFADF